jgi:hypothetical protein
MKTWKNVLIGLVAIIALGFAFIACDDKNGNNSTHTHVWSDWTTKTEVTCTMAKVEKRACSCGEEETQTVGTPLGHNLEGYISNDNATYIADGTETAKCVRFNVCGYTDIKKITDSQKVIVDIATFITEFEKLAPNPTPEEPYTLKVSINSLGGNAQINGSIGNVLYTNNTKRVNLDMSGSGLGSIDIGAFANCHNLIGFTIPDSVTSIGDSAFGNCAYLVSITIPDSVNSIGDLAFSFCTSLSSVTFKGTIPSSNFPVGSYNW